MTTHPPPEALAIRSAAVALIDLMTGGPGVVCPRGFVPRACTASGSWLVLPNDVCSVRFIRETGIVVGCDARGRAVWVASFYIPRERRASLAEVLAFVLRGMEFP